MNITREVVTDLLPIYFSGEASSDTKSLVEEYFRDNPDFERMARSAGTPLETLRTAPPVAAGSEKEKRDLESVRCGLDRRKWMFGLCLYLTLSPLFFYFTHGHLVSLMIGGVLLEHGGALLVPLFRAPALARGVPGGCDLSYADPYSFRAAFRQCAGADNGGDLRRRNMHLDCGGIDLD